MEVQTEGGLIACACDPDRKDGLAILPKKRIEGFQQERFHSGRNFRELCVEMQFAVKVELLGLESVGAGKFD